MHASVMDFGRRVLTAELVHGARVLEVGSVNVNGSLREHVLELGPALYIGTDCRPGRGVDQVVAAEDLVTRFGAQGFEVVICTEMLEHAQDWRGAVLAMKTVLAPGGLILLTTRSPGFPKHDHPNDFWRFRLTFLGEVFADFQVIELREDAPGWPGVLVLARKPRDWCTCKAQIRGNPDEV